MSLQFPLTYNIDVRVILFRRRGQYDLEDEFLWFNQFLRRDRRWRWISGGSVVISDDSTRSLIQLDCPNIELMNEKQHFVEICGGEEWTPPAVVLRLTREGILTDESRDAIDELRGHHLLFLKKAGPGIGGGFDVNAIVTPRKGDVAERVEQLIEQQNQISRYRRKIFILQAGVEHPLLTPHGQKMDLRLYVMIVGLPHRSAFYACKVGDLRNTALGPYDPLSEDPRLQVTNISQNKTGVSSLSEITRVFSSETTPEWYDIVFPKFLHIAKRLGEIYGPLLQTDTSRRRVTSFVTLIGLDAVIDSRNVQPMIVELNRRPTVYTPEEAREMGYSSALFMYDLFRLGVQAIADGTVGQVPSPESQFVLVHRMM